MGDARIAAISDAGPLLHLAEIDSLALLSVFESIHIPEAVYLEILRHNRTVWSQVMELGNIHSHTLVTTEVDRFIEANTLQGLHFGERECLCLCQQIHVPVILTDDLAVRDAAKHLHFLPVGSLGIIVKAYMSGKISMIEAKHHLWNLYEISSLFVTKVIVEMAVEQLKKRNPNK